MRKLCAVLLPTVVGASLALATHAPAQDCVTDEELMSSVLVRYWIAEATRAERCQQVLDDPAIEQLWKTVRDRHSTDLDASVKRAQSMYARRFGSQWPQVWKRDFDTQWERSRTDAVATMGADACRDFRSGLEAFSIYSEWQGFVAVNTPLFLQERSQIPACEGRMAQPPVDHRSPSEGESVPRLEDVKPWESDPIIQHAVSEQEPYLKGPFSVTCYQAGQEIFNRRGLYQLIDPKTDSLVGWRKATGEDVSIPIRSDVACLLEGQGG